MGWWSEDLIGGGDDALDAIGDLERAIGWDYEKSGFMYESDKADEALRRLSTKTGRQKMQGFLRKLSKDNFEMSHGGVLAVCALLVKLGVKFTKEMEKIARDAAEQDNWANEDGVGSLRMSNVMEFLGKLDKAVGKGEGKYRPKTVYERV